jgi:hypothetical protein
VALNPPILKEPHVGPELFAAPGFARQSLHKLDTHVIGRGWRFGWRFRA